MKGEEEMWKGMNREYTKTIAGEGERFEVLVVVVLTTHVFRDVTLGGGTTSPTAVRHIPEDSNV